MNDRDNGSLLRERIEHALGSDDPRVGRLGAAGTSVCFQIGQSTERSITVLLDRDPPSVLGGDEPAEITIELEPEQAERLARGGLSLPPALLAGLVGFRGPIRKYLVVDPVLRSMLAELEGMGGHY